MKKRLSTKRKVVKAGLIPDRFGYPILNPGERVVILTFHSGEDRLVKKSIEELRKISFRTVTDSSIKNEICQLTIFYCKYSFFAIVEKILEAYI